MDAVPVIDPVSVLLVEDSASDAAIISRYFEDSGNSDGITHASSIGEARSMLGCVNPDVMLCDYHLPDGECTELISSLAPDRDFPAVVMTARGDERVAVEAIKSGALDYVVKSPEVFAAMPRICDRAIREWRHVEESKQLEVQLQESQRLNTIGQLAGAIAHDFNNVLTPILLTSHMLVRDLQESGNDCERARRIQRAAQRAKQLAERILAFGRHSAPVVGAVAVGDLVSETLKLVRATLPPTFEIHEVLESGDACVSGDETQLHQVLMNLCTNAYQAIGESGGRLDVTAREIALNGGVEREDLDLVPGDYLQIEVRDDGPGIDAQTREHMFEAFYTTKPRGEGTGLGLSVVKKIVEEHGGAVRVNSVPGEGAAFSVYLPISCRGPRREPIEAVAGRGDERILLIDDEDEVGRVTAELLESYGYRVEVFESPVEGLAAWYRDPGAYDLVITDQVMPGVAGHEIADAVRASAWDTPVLVMTGHSERVNQSNYREYGFDFLVMKPLDPVQFGAVVRQVLDDRR